MVFDDRRQAVRVFVPGPAWLCCSQGERLHYPICDVSSSGLAVVHDWRRLVADDCRVQFGLPGPCGEVTVHARCSEVYRRPLGDGTFRTGLVFTDIDAGIRRRIEAYAASGRAAPGCPGPLDVRAAPNLREGSAQRRPPPDAARQELDELLYVIAHDLKAPLRSVSYLASSLEEAVSAPAPPAECAPETLLSKLRARVTRMHEMLDALLRYGNA